MRFSIYLLGHGPNLKQWVIPKDPWGQNFILSPRKRSTLEHPPRRDYGCPCAESWRLVTLCRADVLILDVLLLLIARTSAVHTLSLWDTYTAPFMKSISFLNCFAVIGPLSLAVRRMVLTSRCISPGPRRPGTTCLRNAICHLYSYCRCPDLELFQPLDALSLRREIALPRAS